MTLRFSIEAMSDPQTLPRTIGYFAQRWITPAHLSLCETPAGLRVEIDVADISERDAAIIASKLQQNVLIFAATSSLLPERLASSSH